jgi:hypothetical protein
MWSPPSDSASTRGSPSTPLVLVVTSERGPIYVDMRTIERSGRLVAAWFRTEFKSPGERGESVWMDRRQYDCVEETHRLLAWRELRSDGQVMTSNEDVALKIEPVRPGTVGRAQLDFLCAVRR